MPTTEPTNEKEKALRKFVDNWTCDEFGGFVEDCERVVDGLEIDPESDVGRQAEEVSLFFSTRLGSVGTDGQRGC